MVNNADGGYKPDTKCNYTQQTVQQTISAGKSANM